jgi:carboxypeptidase PM20D1
MTLLIRTLLFKSKKEEPIVLEPIEFDREKATKDLKELIKCKTISYTDNSLEDIA